MICGRFCWGDGEGGSGEYTLVGGAGLTYDGRGNLAGRSGWSYAYDSLNRLTSASSGTDSMAVAYDARNRSIKRVINGQTRFLYYDGWSLVQERDAAHRMCCGRNCEPTKRY